MGKISGSSDFTATEKPPKNMKKTGKALNNIMKVVYILLAIIWVAASLIFLLAVENLDSVGKVFYFLPVVVMLIVLVMGIIHLSKDNYKTRDAVALAVLPWAFIIIEFIMSRTMSTEVMVGSFFQSIITGVIGILIFIVKYTKQDIQENESLSKILDNMMKAVYAIAAVIWVVLSIFLFTKLREPVTGAKIIIYFIPLLVVLAIIVSQIYFLMKEKHTMVNALIVTVLGWAWTIIGFINLSSRAFDSLGITILVGYMFPALAVGILGIIIVVLMAIRRKYSK